MCVWTPVPPGSLPTTPATSNPHLPSPASWAGEGACLHSLCTENQEDASSHLRQEILPPNPGEFRVPGSPCLRGLRGLQETHATTPRIQTTQLNQKECWERCFNRKLSCFLTLAVSRALCLFLTKMIWLLCDDTYPPGSDKESRKVYFITQWIVCKFIIADLRSHTNTQHLDNKNVFLSLELVSEDPSSCPDDGGFWIPQSPSTEERSMFLELRRGIRKPLGSSSFLRLNKYDFWSKRFK